MKRAGRAAEFLAWAALLTVLAALAVVRLWVLPEIERYREHIAAFVSRSVGQPVTIGAIEARWVGINPRLRVRDVRVYDGEGREALILPAVEKVLAWRALLTGAVELGSLTIEAPRLHVRRDTAGDLHVAGVKLSAGGGQLGGWLLAQPDIVVREAEIHWHDEMRAAPPLVLSAVDLRVRNAHGERAIGLTGRPPQGLGTALDLRAVGSAAADPSIWSGRLYAELGETDLAAWRAWVDYPLALARGHGALRFWLTVEHGEVRGVTADVALSAVQGRLAPELAPLAVASVEGRLLAQVNEQGYQLAGRNLTLRLDDGRSMPPTDFRASWQPGTGGSQARGTLSASRLELAPLARLAAALPLPAGPRELLKEIAPRGRLLEVSLAWNGQIEAPKRYAASGRFAALGASPWRGVPGFSGLSGRFEVTDERGRVQLGAKNSVLDVPSVLPQPRVALAIVEGEIGWERQADGSLRFRFPSLAFSNADFSGRASGSYHYSGKGPGVIDLAAQFDRAEGAQTDRYLPHAAILGGAHTRDWIATAVRAGRSDDVRLRLQGDLRDFPFRHPDQGEFSVRARITQGVLDYREGWPRIEQIDGELVFERDRMEVLGRSASIYGAALSDVRVAIPQLDAADPRVLISGAANGATAQFLRFVRESPVHGMVGAIADGISADGSGRLRLKVDLPLADPSKTRLTGEYEFAAERVTVHRALPPIERAAGRLAFTEASVQLHGLEGRLFGGPVELSGATRPDGSIHATARGEASVEGIRSVYEHPWQTHLTGSAPYLASVELQEGRMRTRIESSLRGIESRLPAPLGKSATDTFPLRLEIAPAGDGERVTLALGRVLAADLVRRPRDNAMSVQRASIAFGPAEPLRQAPAEGTLVYGTLAALDVDAWRALVGGPQASGATALDVRIGVLDAHGKRVHDVAVHGKTHERGWSAAVRAKEMAGELDYSNQGDGRLTARFTRFHVPGDTPGATSSGGQPKALPAIDFAAERFSYGARDLGRVELSGEPVGGDWRIDRLAMSTPDAIVVASGLWRGAAPAGTTLRFELQASDAGSFLGRVGYPGVVRGGRAELKGQLSWNGAPRTLDYPSLTGAVELHARDGQFLEIDPGMGKLLSLMSLQQLPRRVALDFRDVFSKGFDFDRIDSAGDIKGGVMDVRDFRMRGSSAQVEMRGAVDLAREEQDLRVRVMPRMGDSASTLIALVNPLLAIPAAIVQKILKDPLGHIFAFDYAVSGGWTDPKVERLGVEAHEAQLPPGQ